jgi:hypothetical protein
MNAKTLACWATYVLGQWSKLSGTNRDYVNNNNLSMILLLADHAVLAYTFKEALG